MEVIKETLWKRCLSTPTKPPAKNSNICLSETAYQHKGTRKKCKKINQAAIIQWQRQYLMYKPHRNIASPDRSRKQATFLSRVPVHCITPFCSDALVSPPNLYPPCSPVSFCVRLSRDFSRLPQMESLLTGLAYSENALIYVSDSEHHNACHKLRLQLLLIDHDAARDTSWGGERLEATVFGALVSVLETIDAAFLSSSKVSVSSVVGSTVVGLMRRLLTSINVLYK